jgi:hypothetical protein
MKKKFLIPLIAILVISSVCFILLTDFSKYEVQYIKVQSVYDEYDEFPHIYTIASTAELEQYREENPALFEYTHDSTDSISLANVVVKYTDAFFNERYLVIVALWEPSGSNKHKVTKIEKDGNIKINRLIPPQGNAAIAVWHLLIELDNDFQPEEFFTTITDVKSR